MKHVMNDQWRENRKALNAKLSLYRTEMSELSRLFQRIVLHGNDADKAALKEVLAHTNRQLAAIMDDIEARRKQDE